MTIEKDIRECFRNAKREDEKGKKHKGLLLGNTDVKKAEEYITRAKDNLKFCETCKKEGYNNKLPEEWYYTLYYCALAIITKFGINSRSQRCSALFLKYVREKDIIDYDNKFIERITVHKEKEKKSDVDEREEARYESNVKSDEIAHQYGEMTKLCQEAISQAEEIVFSNKRFELPKELVVWN